jgi:HlyD family secretion protein
LPASLRRILIVALLATLVVAGLVFAFWPQPVPVDFATIGRGPMLVTIDDEGETRVKDVYQVSAPVNGRALRIEAEVGDPVKGGETVVATIQEAAPAFLDIRSRRQAEAQVAAAEAARALAETEQRRAEAELRFAEADLARAQQLARRDTAAERTVELAELEVQIRRAALAAAAATLEARAAELAAARATLIEPSADSAAMGEVCCLQIKAPVDGTVLQIHRKSEGVVAAGTPLLEIGDPGQLEVVVDLLSQDAIKVRPGAMVFIEDWGGGETLEGRVRRVEPFGFTKVSALGIEEQRVNTIIDLADPGAAQNELGHGFRVRVRIVEWASEAVLKLPLGALFRAGDDWAVFALVDGRAAQRVVKVGHRNDREAEILDGLAEGERVALHPSDQVVEGVALVARTTEALD